MNWLGHKTGWAQDGLRVRCAGETELLITIKARVWCASRPLINRPCKGWGAEARACCGCKKGAALDGFGRVTKWALAVACWACTTAFGSNQSTILNMGPLLVF